MRDVLAATTETKEGNCWKALLHIDQMLMARPTAQHRAEGLSTQAAVLERRMKWAWEEEWAALLADAQQTEEKLSKVTRSDKEEMKSKAKRVSTLTAAGERGRALMTIANNTEVLTNPDTIHIL